MYSPKELEGEVDHSFFDSDCEENGAGDRQLSKQESSQRSDERKGKEMHVLIDQIGTEDQSERNKKVKARLEDILHQEIKSGHNKEKQCDRELIKEEQSSNVHFKQLSGHNKEKQCDRELIKEEQSSNVHFKQFKTIPSFKNSKIRSNSQSDEGSSVESYSSDEERKLDDDDRKLRKNSDGDINSDDDGYHRSDDESEEEDRVPETQSSKLRGHGTPKKCAVKLRNRSRSSSSEPESSHSSEEGSSVYSQKSPVRHHRVGSAHQRDKESEESEDTVTDVTPLSTPDVSPAQSIDLVLPYEPNIQQNVQGIVEAKEEVSNDKGSISSEGEDEPALLQIEKQFDRALISSAGSVGSRRKNYSFSNEEVQRIDRENQRLLRELSRSSARSRSGSSTISSSSSRKSSAPPMRLYHSAINRQKQQERIQKENLAFLKRLESVKATPGLTRDEQLADYQRQCQYIGTHATAIPPLKTKSNKTSGRSSRPCSSPHKARPETAKLRASPRPAWS